MSRLTYFLTVLGDRWSRLCKTGCRACLLVEMVRHHVAFDLLSQQDRVTWVVRDCDGEIMKIASFGAWNVSSNV